MSTKSAKPLSKKAKIVIISVSAAVVFAVALTLILYFTLRPVKTVIDLDFTAVQTENEQQIKVEWETSVSIDEVKITVKNSNGDVQNSIALSTPSAIAKGFATVDASYGKHTVEVTVGKADGSNKSLSKQVNVFADEYVIAPLVATMPVTFFSLNLPKYTNNYSIPTFVWLQRGGAWDYSNMHENVYLIPTGNYSEMSYYTDPYEMYDKTAQWIKELYEINPSSKFHLYYNDFHPWGWMQATVANKIPADKYDVTLLSDGTGSYYAFAKYLNSENSDEVFTEMCRKYNELKTQIAQKGNYNNKSKNLAIDSEELRHYVFCMLTEEQNVSLVLARDFITNDMPKDNPMRPTFLDMIANADNPDRPIQILSMYSLLQAMSENEKTELKNLYKFSDNMFEKAVSENKKIMVLLGTRTDLETDFDTFVKATMKYYGDGYVYYYKGHPGTPTQMDEAKQKRLEALNLIDIDSTISAELIFFFNQDACATGYGSSTYNSLFDKQVCGVWNTRLSDVNTEYKDKVDFTITKLNANDPVYGSLASDNSYLFEFADTTDYNIAIFDKNQNTLKFYKLTDGRFTEINA